jgi:hypothetical protein
MQYHKTKLKNGLRVITVPMKDNPTVTVLVLVETGSKYENKQNNGLSHFLEHMCFKGTKKRPNAHAISAELDGLGSQYNAFTSHEYTGYYAKSDAKHFKQVFDVVSDIYLNSTFPETDYPIIASSSSVFGSHFTDVFVREPGTAVPGQAAAVTGVSWTRTSTTCTVTSPNHGIVGNLQRIWVENSSSPAAVANGWGASGVTLVPDDQVDHALGLAHKAHGILILDVQVGQSTLAHELPQLEKYLSMPDVHLAIDPEFSMKFGNPPGTVIGTFDATDVNYAAQYLAGLVHTHHLPPKILVVHRFTRDMVTNYKQIQPLPEVEIVMDMDGWGSQAKKKGTYNRVIAPEPVQFTGIKLFYKADLKPPSTGLLTESEVLALTPAPIYIQYQ